MSETFFRVLTDTTYSIICKNPGILKYDLHDKIIAIFNTPITLTTLDDVIFYLRHKKGVFVMRGYGYYKNEGEFYSYGCQKNVKGKIKR